MLFALVEKKGGDVDKTKRAADTARTQGKLATWYPLAKKHWEEYSEFEGRMPADVRV